MRILFLMLLITVISTSKGGLVNYNGNILSRSTKNIINSSSLEVKLRKRTKNGEKGEELIREGVNIRVKDVARIARGGGKSVTVKYGGSVIWYVPNVVCYLRFVLLYASVAKYKEPGLFLTLYTVSVGLDGVDGLLARLLGQVRGEYSELQRSL